MKDNIKLAAEAFQRFVEIIKELRDPLTGCPWDKEQTHQSIRDYLIEESYEVLEAIDTGIDKDLAGELGDVLLQVVLHAQIAADRKAFTITDVVEAISEKMIRRHPHVFGEVVVKDSKEVLKNWEQIKSAERAANGDEGTKSSSLGTVPASLPALIQAQRLGEKAATLNFDWRTLPDMWNKVEEEIKELEEHLAAYSPKNPQLREGALHELGDVLFALCQLARWLGVSAEDALRLGCKRFTARFSEMESHLPGPLRQLSDSQIEAQWQAAKARLAKHSSP